MQKVKVLGVVGSPRRNGNTTKLVKQALEGAMSVPGVETEIYEMGGKKFHHCTGCLNCAETGACVFKDDLPDFIARYMQADGIIWGSPIYHMSITGLMKNAIDRMGNSTCCNWLKRSLEIPRLSKVCGTLTVGAHRYGGQDFVNIFMIQSSLVMNGVVVSGDTMLGNYIGAAANTGEINLDRLRSKDVVLEDKEGLTCAENLGKRVAEMTKIIKAGLRAIKDELPSEYFSTWDEA
jgi:multimeric flavodoxin WrbA